MKENKTQITFEIKSLLKFELELVKYPELTSPRNWVQKGLNMLKKYAPRILKYLSREKIMANLTSYHIILEAPPRINSKKLHKTFKRWLRKEKIKRLVFVVLEAMVIPLTPFLALLPGPNVFFYVPALLIYYHWLSFRSLKNLKFEELSTEIVRI